MQSTLVSDSGFDVIVVGAGHAGVEACLANARRGLKTLLITTNLQRIGYMSCNPSIGGLAKGHIVREIDLMGGEMGRAADATCIQFKRLNARKGPAVRGSRSQNDKDLYVRHMTELIHGIDRLKVLEGEVKSLVLKKDRCEGVVLQDGSVVSAKAVILTTGTFMRAVMHIGLEQSPGGRVGDAATVGLSDQLASLGLKVHRLKTGTPPRLKRDSIDWSKTVPQFGDEKFYPFSFRSEPNLKLPQVQCYLSHTNERTHEIIRRNLDQSPMFCGVIEGVGPRYCPSIEDKITRFAEKAQHQTFLEPEGLSTDSIYLQGISTSLPVNVQMEFLKTIPGLENVEMLKPGYAVEYDFIEPTQITHSLQVRGLHGLFLAGQINGTSGYEEAAGQGFLAGVNAGNLVLGLDPLVLGRDQAYLGVLVDDLVTKGTKEPYRMFTSRAEHRLVLREDNTIKRLADVGKHIGLFSGRESERLDLLLAQQEGLLARLAASSVYPNAETQRKLVEIGSPVLTKPQKFIELLRREEISCSDLSVFGFDVSEDPVVVDAVEIEVKYSGYITRQNEVIEQTKRLEKFCVPADVVYSEVRGLSREEVEKLERVRPVTIGQAQRISGVNPSAIQAILVHVKGRQKIRELQVGQQGRATTIKSAQQNSDA